MEGVRNKEAFLQNARCAPSLEGRGKRVQHAFNYLLNEVGNQIEKAILTFLYMSLTQPFFECNKRIASLVTNGVLMQAVFFNYLPG